MNLCRNNNMLQFVFHTILDAALKVVDDSSEDSWEVHHMSALSKTQNEQLIPAGTHQTGVGLRTEKGRHTQRSVTTLRHTAFLSFSGSSKSFYLDTFFFFVPSQFPLLNKLISLFEVYSTAAINEHWIKTAAPWSKRGFHCCLFHICLIKSHLS